MYIEDTNIDFKQVNKQLDVLRTPVKKQLDYFSKNKNAKNRKIAIQKLQELQQTIEKIDNTIKRYNQKPNIAEGELQFKEYLLREMIALNGQVNNAPFRGLGKCNLNITLQKLKENIILNEMISLNDIIS